MAKIERPIPLSGLSDNPSVSVLIASYNYEQYLGYALDSLLIQTYPHFECIVCDDGSTDASPDIAARYARRDKRIKLIAKSNGGVASALNVAFQQSKGDIVCLLDADDYFTVDKLAHVVQHMRDHPAGMVLHAMQVVDKQDRLMYSMPFASEIEQGWIAEKIVGRGGRWRSMPTSALAFRRPVAAHLFPIPEAVFRSEADGFLNTLAPLLTPVAFLPQPLAYYRLHGDNLTGTTQWNAAVVTRYLDALERKTQAVNKRLAELDVTDLKLVAARHLTGIEQRFMQMLFTNRPRSELVRSFLLLAEALLADDLYSPFRKALGIAANLGAILLPVPFRAAWLTRTLHGSEVRRTMQALARGRKNKRVPTAP